MSQILDVCHSRVSPWFIEHGCVSRRGKFCWTVVSFKNELIVISSERERAEEPINNPARVYTYTMLSAEKECIRTCSWPLLQTHVYYTRVWECITIECFFERTRGLILEIPFDHCVGMLYMYIAYTWMDAYNARMFNWIMMIRRARESSSQLVVDTSTWFSSLTLYMVMCSSACEIVSIQLVNVSLESMTYIYLSSF